MLALLAAASMWNRRFWWEVPNLLGSTFYRYRAFRFGSGKATLAGGALELTITGLIGALFGIVFGHVRSRHRLMLLGTLAGLGWFYLANTVLWPRINPLVPMYLPEPSTVLSHLLFGIVLGYQVAVQPADSAANGPSDAIEL